MTRRHLQVSLAAILLAALIILGRPVAHLTRAAWSDRVAADALRPGTVDDASRMNATEVSEIVDVSADDAMAIAQIQSAFVRARAAGVGVSIAGFRHSMGGQTIAPRGIVLNMLTHNRVEARSNGEVVRVQSGAVWRDIIPLLDSLGRSVEVMQSDRPFTVGGSLSANCHGWQHHHPPVASSVQAMTVLTPDGSIVRCSPSERPALFAHILGGYGLFGVILDADLRTVPNERYRVRHVRTDVESYESSFDRHVTPAAGLAYGRISVAPKTYLREAILTTFEREPGPIPQLREQGAPTLARLVFRGSIGSDYGKTLRWNLERNVAPLLERKTVSRNEVLNGDIDVYVTRGGGGTDILHEYFIPKGKLAAFIGGIRPILLRERADLLNVTVRDVRRDDITALPYAREDVQAVVMFFYQHRSKEADASMHRLTQQLIDVALANGGTYYLPYRLHATPDQLRRSYPNIASFFAEKRRLDPDEILVNGWYLRYRDHFLHAAWRK